ncbi:MAG: hypothetical protein ACE141_09110 [Bryobacteraceae bacterium]
MTVGLRLALLAFWFAFTALGAGRAELAIVEKAAGFVGFYSEAGESVARVKVASFPHEAVLSADGHFLYVTENGVLWMTDEGDGGNSVAVIDVQAMKVVGRLVLSRFRRPHGIALDAASRRLLVTTEKPHRLLAWDTVSRKELRDYEVQGKSPHMVTIGPGGEWAFVSNTDSDAVAAVHLATGRVKVIPVGKRPQGGVLAPDGARLYVVNMDSNSITVIDARNQTAVDTISVGGGPGRIAITPDGKTLVYNLQTEQGVGFADVGSRKQVAFVSLGGRPLSLTMSRDGQKAYSSVQDQDMAFVISVAERKIIRRFQLPSGAGPDPVIPLTSP